MTGDVADHFDSHTHTRTHTHTVFYFSVHVSPTTSGHLSTGRCTDTHVRTRAHTHMHTCTQMAVWLNLMKHFQVPFVAKLFFMRGVRYHHGLPVTDNRSLLSLSHTTQSSQISLYSNHRYSVTQHGLTVAVSHYRIWHQHKTTTRKPLYPENQPRTQNLNQI